MSIRCDSTSDNMDLSSGFPSMSTGTAMGWIYRISDPGTLSVLFDVGGNADLKAIVFGVFGGGPIKMAASNWDGTNSRVGALTLALNTWGHLAMAWGGGTITYWLNGVVDINGAGMTAPSTNGLMIGRAKQNTTYQLNGRIAAVKWWDGAQLTTAEVQQEMRKARAVRRANLYAEWPMLNSSQTEDTFGAAHGLTANGTLTTEDGPPVFWGE